MKYLLFLLILATPGCALTGGFFGNLFGDDKGLVVETNIGKDVKVEKNKLKLESGTTKQQAESIENGKQTAEVIHNTIQNIPMEVIFLIAFLAGIAIDGKAFLLEARKDVVGILKAIPNFVLLLFGRDKL